MANVCGVVDMSRRRLGGEELLLEIDVQSVVPTGRRDLIPAMAGVRGGVIDQNVESARRLSKAVHGLDELLTVAEIARQGNRLHRRFARQRRQNLLSASLVDVDERGRRTLQGEGANQCGANARRDGRLAATALRSGDCLQGVDEEVGSSEISRL